MLTICFVTVSKLK